MKSASIGPLRIGAGTAVLATLSALALGLIAYRFLFGLGAVTNLSDGYPWGFWIGVDVLVGIALASGGFVVAGAVHLLGIRRLHALARPAILTALLGYLLFIGALTVDLGRPWNIWKAIISWNHLSPMFEVSWCVALYTFVLLLEITPAVLERFHLERQRRWWYQVTPLVSVFLLTAFAYAMSASVVWAGVIFVLLTVWEALMRAGIMPRDQQVPLLLIMAGVILSTLHQSSLGTLFLITDKLTPLWYTPFLPLLFLLSAVMVGPAMVVAEALATARLRGTTPELSTLGLLVRPMPYLIGGYLTIRVLDVVLSGEVLEALTVNGGTAWWWLEIVLLLTALAQFSDQDGPLRQKALLIPSLLTILGLVVNRTGVAIIGLNVPEYATYVPSWPEVMITVGILSLGLLAFRVVIGVLPIYQPAPSASVPREERGAVPVTAEPTWG